MLGKRCVDCRAFPGASVDTGGDCGVETRAHRRLRHARVCAPALPLRGCGKGFVPADVVNELPEGRVAWEGYGSEHPAIGEALVLQAHGLRPVGQVPKVHEPTGRSPQPVGLFSRFLRLRDARGRLVLLHGLLSVRYR